MAQTDKDKQPDAPPPRRNWSAPVARDAGPVGHAAFVRAGFSDPTLILRWEEIAGRDIARIAQPVKLSEGASGAVLTLRAEPGAAVFLQHESRALCGRINAWLGHGAVARLRFVHAPLPPRPKPQPLTRPRGPLAAGDPALSFRGKDSLREALVRLAQARKTGGKAAD